MFHTPLNKRTNTFGLLTPPPSFRDLPGTFNDQFTARNFIASNENTRDTPATVEQPAKRHRIEVTFKDKSDTEVWALSDEEIIEKQFAKCTSDTWKHYRITVQRHAGVITFVFQCKQSNPKHPKYTRDRSKMKQGRSNLGEAAKKCEGAREQSTANTVVVPYNEARHRAICAIRCAANKRSFASQDDEWYHLEVELLRPGTIPPSSKIVARDVGVLYSEYAKSR
ncbi:hypothetical protein B0H11DRAFT_2270148 [Mycena galericulata]|nr:hypothetical protein B0H11DRAFT_2270148 [Mycena galericulata]